MAKQPVDLTESYQGSAIAKQAFDLKRQVKQKDEELQELQAEIATIKLGKLDTAQKAELEQQIQALTAQLAQAGGVQKISIDQVQRNPKQPRQMITEAMVKERAASLEEHGQQAPIILFPPNDDGISLIFDGELRWRGANLLNSKNRSSWQALDAVYLTGGSSPEDPQMLERAIVTSLHAEKLCALDLAENLVDLIAQEFSFNDPQKQIPEHLNFLVNKLKASGRSHEFSDIRSAEKQAQTTWIESIEWRSKEQDIVLKVLLKFKLNPASINTNIFPVLSYPDDLKEAIRSAGLEDGKVRELAKLHSERLGFDKKKTQKIRVEATQEVVSRNLSVRDTRTLVNQIINQHSPQQASKASNYVTKLNQSLEKFPVSKTDRESLMVLHKSLKSLLSKVEEKLDVSSEG
ncbi:MAG: ParB N-terminal domain-containing protein [Tatlockia sp.]|nr:ParB N-terminal domain-containing protein [Tatlockia sp.]